MINRILVSHVLRSLAKRLLSWEREVPPSAGNQIMKVRVCPEFRKNFQEISENHPENKMEMNDIWKDAVILMKTNPLSKSYGVAELKPLGYIDNGKIHLYEIKFKFKNKNLPIRAFMVKQDNNWVVLDIRERKSDTKKVFQLESQTANQIWQKHKSHIDQLRLN